MYKAKCLIVLLLGLLNLNLHAQQLNRTESNDLLENTYKANVKAYEKLIDFVLTKDTYAFESSMNLFKEVVANYRTLEKNGTGNEWFFLSIDAQKLIAEGDLSRYFSDYYKNKILDDFSELNKDVKFNNKEYQISKKRKTEFEILNKSYVAALKSAGIKK